ncbi:hypothetical protein [Microvirga mediterraneensis]|uniref:ApeA N-terminal domain-containing protein n=1 Tax=Microvirga mediterraneensis TaxID=2754695 RepID=A0A838BSJ2_9HYPH|nr:hypothetical protein [Microvirga mediterraneensis]MBA1158527.1 hypothetical protein [Microvirga mediterraneensis]
MIVGRFTTSEFPGIEFSGHFDPDDANEIVLFCNMPERADTLVSRPRSFTLSGMASDGKHYLFLYTSILRVTTYGAFSMAEKHHQIICVSSFVIRSNDPLTEDTKFKRINFSFENAEKFINLSIYDDHYADGKTSIISKDKEIRDIGGKIFFPAKWPTNISFHDTSSFSHVQLERNISTHSPSYSSPGAVGRIFFSAARDCGYNFNDLWKFIGKIQLIFSLALLQINNGKDIEVEISEYQKAEVIYHRKLRAEIDDNFTWQFHPLTVRLRQADSLKMIGHMFCSFEANESIWSNAVRSILKRNTISEDDFLWAYRAIDMLCAKKGKKKPITTHPRLQHIIDTAAEQIDALGVENSRFLIANLRNINKPPARNSFINFYAVAPSPNIERFFGLNRSFAETVTKLRNHLTHGNPRPRNPRALNQCIYHARELLFFSVFLSVLDDLEIPYARGDYTPIPKITNNAFEFLNAGGFETLF